MASINKTKAGTYRVRWREDDGGGRSETFERYDQAKAKRAEVEAAKAKGAYLDDRLGRQSVEGYGRAWLANLPGRPSTVRTVRNRFEHHLFPYLGARPIGAVRHSEVEGWLGNRARVLAPLTLRTLRTYVWRMFRAAAADGVIGASPCRELPARRGTLGRAKAQAYGDDELAAITALLPARWRALASFGARTGLRPGELLGLCVDRVDFLRREVAVDRQVREGRLTAELKTPASRRVVLVDEETLGILAAHLAAYPAGRDGLIFTNRDGGPLFGNTLDRAWRRAVERAGVRPGAHPHELRHTYASRMLAAGASIPFLCAQLGHSGPGETLGTYAHWMDDEAERDRAVIAKAFAGTGQAGGMSSSASSRR